ncbi:MAG: SGNH/GDSL hydrolase family protein [Methanobacteriaceae archaeon]|nr:SGNH/GDSL hydrolase family protein [Methanobacteriaceae archaeon]MDO9626752.1 SGNH/GDSL hydrolase family protein [Methanobacteriaceae archaeon]
MKTILCFGDSNTWGYNPVTGERLGPCIRWPGVLKNELDDLYIVIEEGLNGRTTLWDDPLHGGFKNGKEYLIPCLASHKPLDLVILFLGTNDLKSRFSLTASEITNGIRVLLDLIVKSGSGIDENPPKILLVSPPLIGELSPSSRFSEEFEGSNEKSEKLGSYFKQAAEEYNCEFLDSSKVVRASDVDGIHLEADEHLKLGRAMKNKVLEIL